ncbi:hypothetical protein JOD97_004489 [Duganella sp. 1411]|uniref:hypothetical protein n=1 Tax=Duganella sp. 1411 TaxID=2806572 RepID=UPI001AE9C352|nr:hypothetical protein [Duganella sp. 1411]MBP1206416.1 hypothetical protein [Duganella sp. 1411]
MPQDLQPLQAAQRYILVDQRRLKRDALARFDNYAATAFRVDRLETTREISDELEEWRRSTPLVSTSTVHQAITRWAAHRLRRRGQRRIIGLTGASKEVEAMSVPIFSSLDDALRYEALLDGHRERLKKMLIKRFGPLSARLNRRITYAEMDDLDRWFDRLLDAKSVRQVFADKQPA